MQAVLTLHVTARAQGPLARGRRLLLGGKACLDERRDGSLPATPAGELVDGPQLGFPQDPPCPPAGNGAAAEEVAHPKSHPRGETVPLCRALCPEAGHRPRLAGSGGSGTARGRGRGHRDDLQERWQYQPPALPWEAEREGH